MIQSHSPLFLAAVETVEESVYNSLLRATTVRGREGHTTDAVPVEDLRELHAFNVFRSTCGMVQQASAE